MLCTVCGSIVEAPATGWHVIRPCTGCGRDLRIAERGKDGKGLKINKGDRVVIPNLQISFNPLKSHGQISKSGLHWFATLINLDELPKKKDDVLGEMEKLKAKCDKLLEASPILREFNLDNEDDVQRAFEKLCDHHQESAEWWAFATGVYLSFIPEAISANDINIAIWAIGCAERCRAMLVFKENLEDPLLMAQSARKIIDIMRIWDSEKSNALEAFWQSTFREHVYALSQVFAVPMVLIGEGTYVGGMTVDRKSAKYADFLFSHESSKEAAIVEIKTPVTKLLGRTYRGTYQPSSELVGAVMQALDYRRSLAKDHGVGITEGTVHELAAFSPRCLIVIGNARAELTTPKKVTAFELYRSNFRDLEVVTYDELFKKIETLASLFGLVRTKST